MSDLNLRKHVFVSYSHHDLKWLQRLKIHLKPYLRGERLHLWDDSQIELESLWREVIDRYLDQARVAVLLVSPDFLASDFLNSFALPKILDRAKSDLILIWVPVAASAYKTTPLGSYEAVIDPEKPLTMRSKVQQGHTLTAIAERIASAMDINAMGNALRVIDALTPEIEAFSSGTTKSPRLPPQASYAKQSEHSLNLVENGESRKLVDMDDLQGLDKGSQKLIRAYEFNMKELFERWTELKAKRIARDPDSRAEANERSENVRQELCAELTELLTFIESMGMQLQDHYQHVRFICNQPGR